MSISSSLSAALSGLHAASRAAETVSSNISNALTEGYGRREVQQSSQVLQGNGAGVRVDGISRHSNPALTGSRRLAESELGQAAVQHDFLAKAEAAIGLPDDPGSLTGRVTALEAALIEAASRPDSEARLQGVLDSAKSVASHLNDVTDTIQSAREAADRSIASAVDDLNAKLEQIASLNSRIAQFGATFQKMLTVQMQNWDPLNPIKSEDFAVQLATFSSVEQQVRTNELIEGMSGQLGLMGLSQMAGWVGMEARAPVAAHFDGSPVSLSAQPQATAERRDLVVRDASGAEVQRVAIPPDGGAMEWTGLRDNGTAFAAGLYSFETEAFVNGASLGTQPAEVYVTIVEARTDAGQTMLIADGGVQVPASAITALASRARRSDGLREVRRWHS